MKSVNKKFLVIFLIVVLSFPIVHAQTIPITISSRMNNVTFDGKWSFTQEWKESSLTQMGESSNPIYLRTAHWQNYVYVMIDDVENTNFEKNSDRAIVCFDTNDDKSKIADMDDYCFISILNGKTFVLQGGSDLAANDNFNKISIPSDFIAVGSISDEHDRYTNIPHPSYEFKIPTKLIGRSDHYGFYVSVYDATKSKSYTWPGNENSLKIPSPQTWGELFSPDKSLPEFPYPAIAFVLGILVIVYYTRFSRNNFLKN